MWRPSSWWMLALTDALACRGWPALYRSAAPPHHLPSCTLCTLLLCGRWSKQTLFVKCHILICWISTVVQGVQVSLELRPYVCTRLQRVVCQEADRQLFELCRVHGLHGLNRTRSKANCLKKLISKAKSCNGFKTAYCLQVRGSIPLYWNQEGVTHLKPDITLQHYDPLYTATRLHFKVHLALHTMSSCWLY